MNFTYARRIRFSDTDAAGVVYFANYLSFCHEAYEESLLESGIELHRFFAEAGVILPISHADCDFLRPLRCGDSIEVIISPVLSKGDGFTLNHEIFLTNPTRKLAAKARTDHVCIDAVTRRRVPLPQKISAWVAG